MKRHVLSGLVGTFLPKRLEHSSKLKLRNPVPCVAVGSRDSREIERLGETQFVPGMPAEISIRTGLQTVLSYLMKPLSDRLRPRLAE